MDLGKAGGGPPPLSMPQSNALITRLESLILSLTDTTKRDDVKNKDLREISENFDELSSTPACAPLLENLIRAFIRLLQDTHPQFISENNTLQLRKLVLELLLRMSTSEVLKNYSKQIQVLLLRIAASENEENALIIIKILTDHIKAFRPAFYNELSIFFTTWKNAYREMFRYASEERMFLSPDYFEANCRSIEDFAVTDALQNCYLISTLSFKNIQPQNLIKYSLIPRAIQSVRVLAEMSVFLLFLIQSHRQHLFNEIAELLPLFVRYVNIIVPKHLRTEKTYNKELVDEFHNSQVRALTFIAYTTRQSQLTELIAENAMAITNGINQLFDSLNGDVIQQRRDLLLAIKYFFQCEMRAKFIGIIPRMTNDSLLIGTSFTSREQLRNHAYTILADILHHVRMSLPFVTLTHIYFIASRNLHDPLLLPFIQTMYGKLMMNLVEPLIGYENQEGTAVREILLCAIDSFVRKTLILADYHLPLLFEKYRTAGNGPPKKNMISTDVGQLYWQETTPFSLNDCKNMIRFILQPMKMIIAALNEINNGKTIFTPNEVELLSKFFVYALKCLDVFMIGSTANTYQKSMNSSGIRSKEEKEAIDAFISVYSTLDPVIFYEIMNKHVEFFVDRISKNHALQSICNSFFIHQPTASKMGTVLVQFLLKRLPEMGLANERASLYLKLFKLVFSAVSCSQQMPDCENMLKPFLHDIVQNSMQLALRCRESTNFFLLLRVLFRSIGSGAHDLLYQEFLPLLPSILQQLNRLQNCSHRQTIHELFVELCLTVPVRLSSLLPYLPLLMDPLVCALYGSPTLVKQGLRTLELCVDNLQPEYFYDHMAPVRAALLQGLWRTVASLDYQSAFSAFRILGKFAGSSRKVLLDPRSVDYDRSEYNLTNSSVMMAILFGHKSTRNSTAEINVSEMECGESMETKKDKDENVIPFWCNIPLKHLVESATALLRCAQNSDFMFTNVIGVNTVGSCGGGANSGGNNNASYVVPKAQSLEIIRLVLLSAISSQELACLNVDQFRAVLEKGVEMAKMRLESGNFSTYDQQFYHEHDKASREFFATVLTGLFCAVVNNDLRPRSFTLFREVIRYLTTQAILEFGNVDCCATSPSPYLSVSVLVDALTATLADPCKDFCHTVVAAMKFMIDTAVTVFGSEKVFNLPFFEYLLNEISLLCYRREWYSRLGGCTALRFIIENYPAFFVRNHATQFLTAFIEVNAGLADEVSSGVLDFSAKSVDAFLPVCFSSVDEAEMEQMIAVFMPHIIEHLDDSEALLRDECLRILHGISRLTKRSVAQLIGNRVLSNSVQLSTLENLSPSDVDYEAQASDKASRDEFFARVDKLTNSLVDLISLSSQNQQSLLMNTTNAPEISSISGGDAAEHRYDSAVLLQVLQQLWTLMENVKAEEWAKEDWSSDAKLPRLFRLIRQLWTSDAFFSIFSIRVDFAGDELARCAPRVEPAKYEVPVYCARILLAYLKVLLLRSSTAKAFTAENTENRDDGGGQTPANTGQASSVPTPDAEDIDQLSIDLVYDLMHVFCSKFISDFTFVRSFVEVEIIPSVSLEWRRKAFKKVIVHLRSLEQARFRRKVSQTTVTSVQLVRFMQCIVMPCFHYAFEKYDVDSVVGSAPNLDVKKDDNNVVSILGEYIEMICAQNKEASAGASKSGRGDSNAHCMSDAMTIVMYQFCVLLVQKCPAHIHDNMRKQQQDGSRLRSFMLFGWPCLQANFSRDLTEKYAGHLLIANIIDKFAINRKIVLQVLNSLVMAHLPDYKEIVRKALDILIPAVPRRMDDGYVQLYTIVKKAIVEESRSSAQVAIHCLNIIIRHYKVFYFVRHQLSHVLLSTLQRLLSSQFGYELRRLVVDVCDMFIKWEQERQRIINSGSAMEQAASTPPPCQATTSGNVSGDKFASLSGGMSAPTIGESTISTDSQQSSSPGQMSTASATTVASGGGASRSATSGGVIGGQPATSTADDVHRPMEKAIIDNILLLLVRIATTSSSEMNSGNVSSSNLEQISKRSIMLLRVALKLTVFGQVSSVKSHWFEKHLALPNPEQFSDQNAINHQLNQVHVTLDVLSNIINYMSQQSIVDVFRQLQRSIILCLNSSNTQIVRSTYSVISKLLDKTNSSSNGLLEFEMLNQAINKYIYDSFASYYGSMASPSQSTFMTITLLKIIYSIQPAYLDTVCLAPFLKTIQRLVRDCQQPPPSVAGSGGNPSYADANKVYSDILCVCLEMVAARLSYFSFEAKRSITQLILVPLIDKSSTDRVLEIVIRCINALITGGDPSATSQPAGCDTTSGGVIGAQPPPPLFSTSTTSVVNNLGIGLLIRMCSALESRILANGDLLKSFLLAVLYVFESGRFDESSDIVSKLNNCFYWGLCCNDNELRLRCFAVLQKHFPVDIYDRMLYSIGRQNWQPMGSYFWITHLVHLLLLSDCPTSVISSLSSSSIGLIDNGNASESTAEKTKSSLQHRTSYRLKLTNCATFSSFWENVVRQIRPSIIVKMEENPQQQQPSSQATDASTSDDLYSVVRAPPFPDDPTAIQQDVSPSASSSQQEIKMEVDAVDEGGCSSGGGKGSGTIAESSASQQSLTMTQVSTAPDYEVESGSGNAMDVDEVTEEGGVSKQLTAGGEKSKATGTATVAAATSSKVDNNKRPIDAIFDAHYRLLNLANHGDKLSDVVTNFADFIHYDWKVAKAIFIEFFHSFWTQLGAAERDQLSALAQPFLASTMMLTQKDSLLSVAATFLEAFVHCSPKIDFRPSLLRHLGETHNCHHFAIRLLEERAARIRLASKEALASIAANPQLAEELEVLDNLADLYTTLGESDQHWAVWKRRAYFDKTTNCLALFNQGENTQARDSFEKFVAILNERLSRGVPPTIGDQASAVVSEVSPALHTEVQLWERYWVDSCRELGDWSTLLEFANNEEIADCGLLMDAAWHLDEWPLLNDCVQQVDASADRKLYGKTSLYKLMYSVTTMDISKDTMDKSLLDISKYLINEWRKLPRLVSMSHVKLLGDAQWVHEVSEASSILHAPPGNPVAQSNNIKHLMKSWRNRPLAQLDPISTWSSIFKWRYQHYVSLKMDNALHTSQHSTFITHTLVQSQLNLARLLRRSNQLEMALNVLNTLHELPTVLTLDAQLKIYEHAKCLIKLASLGGGAAHATGNPFSSSSAASKLGVVMPDALYEALEIIESTQLQFMKREQVARILLTKGILLSKLEKNEDASQAFSQSALLEECTTTSSPLWKHWGRHVENIFLSHPSESTAVNFGMQAIACFMECAKNSSQLKSRNHLARVFWLLKVIWSCGAQLESKQEELLRENIPLVSPSNWLFWVNEIIADIRQRPGTAMSQLLYTVAEAYPQQVFYALRMNLKPSQISERIQKVCDGLPAFSAWNDTNHHQRSENNGFDGIGANGPPTSDDAAQSANGSDAMDATTSTTFSMTSKAENNGGDGAGNSAESRNTPPIADAAATAEQFTASSAATVAAFGGTASSTATLRQRRRSGRCGMVADWQQKLLCALETLCARQPSSIRVLNQLLNELDAFAEGGGDDKMTDDYVADRKLADAPCSRRSNPLEKVLYWLRDTLNECNEQMFVNISNVANEIPSRDLYQRFLQLTDDVEQLLGGGEHAFRLPSDFEALKSLLASLKSEFAVSEQLKHHLHKMASFLRYWLQRIVERLKASEESRRHRLAAASRLLGNFRSKMASIDVFNGPIAPRITSHIAQIAHFMPIYHCFVRHYTVRRLLMVRSLNGRTYSYFLEKARLDEVSGSIFQLFSMLNTEFSKDRATSQRLIQFAMPKVLHIGRHARLTECGSLAGTSSQLRNGSGGGGGGANSSLTLWSALVASAGSGGSGIAGGSGGGEAFSFHTFIDIFDEMLRARRTECGLLSSTALSAEQSMPDSSLSLEVVDHYYARLLEQRHCHKTLLDLFNEIANASPATRLGSSGDSTATIAARPPPTRHVLVPKDLLVEWMTRRYPDASCLWTARRNLATSFALLGFVEFAMFLSSMNLNELVIDVSTAQLFFGGYHFDLSKKICDSAAGKVVNIELDATRPVAFRISSNIAHFLDISIDGHFSGALISIARCLNSRGIDCLLRPILWDVFFNTAIQCNHERQAHQEQCGRVLPANVGSVIDPVKRSVDTIVQRIKLYSQLDVASGSSTTGLLVSSQHADNLCRMDPNWHPWF